MHKKSYFKDLTKNYGIGTKKVAFFFIKLGLNLRNKKIIYLNKLQNIKILRYKNKNIINNKLKARLKKIIKFPQKIRVYKGLRNKYKYPCRGQRTRTNAKTKKRFKI
jgi:small subunit ribosomal protein S13